MSFVSLFRSSPGYYVNIIASWLKTVSKHMGMTLPEVFARNQRRNPGRLSAMVLLLDKCGNILQTWGDHHEIQ